MSGAILHRAAVEEMRDEFEASRLVVVLIPTRRFANDGGCVRVAADKNCKWYRDFCASYPSKRKRKNAAFDTRIKRANTRAALSALLRGDASGVYASHLLAIARQRASGPSALDLTLAARRRALNAAAAGF